MSAGIEKLGESFTEPLKNLFEQNEENGNELKVLNNYESSSALKYLLNYLPKLIN